MSCVDFLDCVASCTTNQDCGSDGVCQNGKCTHATGGATCACAPPPTYDYARSDVYVGGDPAAISGSGAVCPYATIAAAVAGVTGAPSPVIIHVSPGTYDAAHGEIFPIVVRGAISIAGAGIGTTIVDGYGAIDHSLDGGAFDNSASGWQTFGAAFQVGDVSATVSLSGMTITRPPEAGATNTFFGVFCDRGNLRLDDAAPPAPNTSLAGLAIGPGFFSGVTVSNSTASACNLSLTGSTITGDARGVWVIGCGLVAQKTVPGVAALIGDGTSGGGNILSTIYGSVATEDVGYGIDMFDCTKSLMVRGNTFVNGGMGMTGTNHQLPVAALTIDDNSFNGMETSAASFDGTVEIAELDGNTFEGTAGFAVSPEGGDTVAGERAALVLHDGVQVHRARDNQFLGNNIGVYIDGALQSSQTSRALDFGTTSDPGNNVFRCNSRIEGDYGFDLWVDRAGGADPVSFAGNQWDHAPPTLGTSTSAADGTDVVDTSASGLPAIVTTNSAVAAVACPPGKTTASRGPLE
jgi:hypothetical protein